MKRFYSFVILTASIFSKMTLEVPYGTFEINNPCLEELIQSKSFERLKKVHQYGISAFNQIDYDYSRYDHCLGVFLILNQNKLSLKEQVSGLLHDASHTTFSHFGDYFFKSHGEDAWQDLNHNEYLLKAGLANIITKNKLKIADVYHKNKHFTALDKPLPDLCADRLDYNMQGAFRHGLITKDELKALFKDLKWDKTYWSFSDKALAKKLSLASITMMESIWSCPSGHVSNMILAKVAEMAVEKKLLTHDDIWLKTDVDVMKILQTSQDDQILKGLELIKNLPSYIKDGQRFKISYKCRALDPYVRDGKNNKRLSEIDNEYKAAFDVARSKASKGFEFTIDDQILEEYHIYFQDLLK
jgi:uncharacterized protein